MRHEPSASNEPARRSSEPGAAAQPEPRGLPAAEDQDEFVQTYVDHQRRHRPELVAVQNEHFVDQLKEKVGRGMTDAST